MEREYLRNARRKALETRGYFDDDGDDESFFSEANDSSSRGPSNAGSAPSNSGGDAEIDPLDAFMAGIAAEATQKQPTTGKRNAEKPLRFDDDDDDSYPTTSDPENKKPRQAPQNEFADSDEEVYATARQVDADDSHDGGDAAADDGDLKKVIEALAPLKHTSIKYESFCKSFYTPHKAVAAMSDDEVRALRQEWSVTIDGNGVPRPIRSFVEVGFDRKMLAVLMKHGLEAPTPIQAQAFPVALSGRDLIGIAKTGSGKTLAFTLPMIVHVMDQRELRKDEGPIAIVLSPTRELAHQIFTQVKKFITVHGANCAAIYGGVGKWDQIQALRKGAEVVVATPGRLIDLMRKKTLKTFRVTFVVLDEADRMFEMGFEPQLRSIMGQIRPDRQTLMFSATFRKRVEALARDVLHDPVKITIGQIGQANEDIHQIAIVLRNNQAKWPWLMANLKQIVASGRVLIFAGSKVGCEEMAKNLNSLQFPCNCLHGDKGQQDRDDALAKFRSGVCPILVATDVASRGLDVKDIKTVVNYDVAKNIDTHVHRIGRTGRMGQDGFEPGTAYTLLTTSQTQFASELVYNMDVSGQPVSGDLLTVAKRDPRFRRGTPANGGRPATTGNGNHQHQHPTGGSLYVADEDEVEMKRWNASQQHKTKADKRQGLGFAFGGGGGGGAVVTSRPGGGASSGFQMAFVKSSAATTQQQQQSFKAGFVQATVPATPARPLAPAPTPRLHHPPPQPAPVTAVPAGLVPPPPPPHPQHAVAYGQVRVPPPPPAAFRFPPPVPVLPVIIPVVPVVNAPLIREQTTGGSDQVVGPSCPQTVVVIPNQLPHVVDSAQRSRSRSQSKTREDHSSRNHHASPSNTSSRNRSPRRSPSRSRSSSRGRRNRSRTSRRSRSRSSDRCRSRSRSRSRDRSRSRNSRSLYRRRRSPSHSRSRSRSSSRSRGRFRR